MMIIQSFNHKKGMNGSPGILLLRGGKAQLILIVAIDVGKFTHKEMMTNIFEDVLVAPFEIDASLTSFQRL